MRTPAKPTRRADAPTRSLRERAAAVEASAARVLHIRAPETAQDVPSGVGPPGAASIQCLRDRWRAALDAVNAPGRTDTQVRRLRAIAVSAKEAVIAAPVETNADLACKVEVLRTDLDVVSQEQDAGANAVRAICADVERLAGAPMAAHADPILPAIADHYAAFVAANSQPTDELSELACRRADQVYATLKATTPTTAAGLCALAIHLRRFLREGGNEIEFTFAGEALIILLDTADRFAAGQGSASVPRTDGRPSWAMPHANAVDLSSLSLTALSGLYDVYCGMRDHWLAVGDLPFCGTGPNAWASPARALAQEESERAAFLASRIADEARLRTQDDAHARDVALSLRVRDELRCEGMILDRDVLMDLVKAGG